MPAPPGMRVLRLTTEEAGMSLPAVA